VPNYQDPNLPASQEPVGAQESTFPASSDPTPQEASHSIGSSATTQPAPGGEAWIWDQLGKTKRKSAELGGRLNEIESLEDDDLKGFMRFLEYAGPDQEEQVQQPSSPGAIILRDKHQSLMQRYEQAKKKGEKLTPLAEEFIALSAADEAVQGALGNDTVTQSFLPGVPEDFVGIMAERAYRGYKQQRSQEASIMDLPEWGELQEWLKANPNGRFENAPEFATGVNNAPDRTSKQVAVQEDIGRILTTLNGAYHSNVNPKGAIYTGQLVGEATRKLAALQLPHAFDDAPLWHKLGVGITMGAGTAAINRAEFATNLGMDAFYASAKIMRNVFVPGAPLPEFIENNYHVGMLEMTAALQKHIGLESVPWDEESGQLISRKMFNDAVNESIWLKGAAIAGGLHGFMTSGLFGVGGMTKLASMGASVPARIVQAAEASKSTWTKGAAWMFGSKIWSEYPRLGKLLGTAAGMGAFNGITELIHSGGKGPINAKGQKVLEHSFLGAFFGGAATAPFYMLAGAMGGKAGDLLLRAKAPNWVARTVGGGIEGLGFAHMHPADIQLAWNTMKDPSKENWEKYMNHVGANMMVMGAFKLMHTTPQQQMRDAILKEHGVDVFSPDFHELQKKAEGEKRARAAVVESFESGKVVDPQAPFKELFFQQATTREQRQALSERTQRMGAKAREEMEIEQKLGAGEEPLVAPIGTERERPIHPALPGESEAHLRRIARDAPLRAQQWLRRQVAKGGPEALKEFGGFVVMGEEGVKDFQTRRPEQGVTGSLPVEKVWEAARKGDTAIADWHGHGNDSFFSGSHADLGVLKEMRRLYEKGAPEELKDARVPFITVGTGHFLVSTKAPGAEMPSEKLMQRAFDMSKESAVKELPQEMLKDIKQTGDKGDIASQRATLQSRASHPAWDSIGLEMKVYTPREFQVLWRDYIDTKVWKTDPMEVQHYKEEVQKRREVLGESRITQGIYPDIGEFKPTPISKQERLELKAEPDAEGFRRTASEITGEALPPTQAGTMRASQDVGVPRPELVGAKEGTFHAEPELPHPPTQARAGEPLRGKLPQPDPSKLQALFGRDRSTKPGGGVLGALREGMAATRSYMRNVFHGNRSLMADVKAGRLGAAEAIEKLGYRARFRKLGEFEDRFVAEVDRLSVEVGSAQNVAGARFFDALEPLGSIGEGSKDPGAAQALRKRSADDLMQLMYLKDFAASAKRGEVLPLGITPEEVQAGLAALKPSKEVLQAEANVRALLDQAGEQLVARGVISREHLKEDYMPHRVADFFDAFSSFTPGRTVGKLRESFRGYTKARKGSERMLDTDPEAVVAYLTQVQKDNAVHDFIVRNGIPVHERMMETLNDVGIRTDFENMTAAEWKQARQDLHDKGMVVYDSRVGDLGKRNLAQDPVAQTIYGEFAARGEMQMPDILEVGRNIKPNAERQVYLVPKEVANLWQDLRAPKKSLINSPTLNMIRKQVGQWFKVPALRGILGLKTIPRQGRNLISDVGAIAFKKTIGETAKVIKQLPAAHRFSRALTDPEWAKTNLTPTEQGLFQEMKVYGTVQGGETGEALGLGGAVKDHPVFKKIYGDWDNWWNLKKHYHGDYKWVRTVDTYSENLFRAATWLAERSKLIGEGLDAESAVRGAHLETGRVLVNYNHNTPFEANVLNTLAFPFWTWIRHQVTSTVAEGLRRPGSMAAKYGTIQAALMAWNYMVAEDEESKMIQSGHRGVQTPHFWLPWIKDSEGNPMMVSWEMPTDMVARFFGLGGAGSKLGDYLFGHGEEGILWRDFATGGIEESALTGGKFMQDWMAPWFRAAGGWMGFKSKFVMPGELLGAQSEKALSAARPIADVMQLLDDRKTLAQKVSGFMPFGKFVELTEGVPADKRALEFFAGRQQRHEAQLSLEVKRWLPRIDNAIKAGNWDRARSVIEDVWSDRADELAPLGYTKMHLANRFWNALQNRWRKEYWNNAPGPVTARFYALNDQQKIAALREMGMLEEVEEEK